jgi:hypothetical protein
MTFGELVSNLDIEEYYYSSGLDVLFNGHINSNAPKFDKYIPNPYDRVDPRNLIPYRPELDDLTLLHYAVTSRKVLTILEFGIGFSTLVFSHALASNKQKYAHKLEELKLRVSNPFECHSIDNYRSWIKKVKAHTLSLSPDPENTFLHYSPLHTSTFNGRVCTYYAKVPNISPNLIYLDGPDQFSAKGNVRGISTCHPDRMPMAADILAFEHFLQPGTLIIVDGRSANSRFLLTNLQRQWTYYHHFEKDQHYFELTEKPLGPYNKRYMSFSQA